MLLHSFMAALNQSLNSKKIKFSYPRCSSAILKILNILIEEGLIEGYRSYNLLPKKKNNKNFIFNRRQGLTVFFRLHRGRYNSLRSVQNVSKPSFKKYITFYNLQTMLFKFPSSIFLISTNRGLVSSSTAFKLKIGGKLLFRLN